MTNEQQQLLDELKKIEDADKSHVGTIAWRARQELEFLIAESDKHRTRH